MKNTYFSIGATLQQLLQRMRQYAQMSLPPEFEHLRLDAEPPVLLWPGDGDLSWMGTFYAVSLLEDDVPFFEMGAQQVDGACRVRVRCLDPVAANWVREMVRWLAPGRASDAVNPLPDLPAQSAPAPTPAAAPTATPAPAPAQAPEPAKKNAPHIPKRPADLRRWKATWDKIKPLVAQGKSNDYIEGWFLKHEDDIRPSKESIIRIIAAGEAGLLD